MTKPYFLYLDDKYKTDRDPLKYAPRGMPYKQEMEKVIEGEIMWVLAKDFDDFQEAIKTYGVPAYVSFDHDLGDFAYDAEKGMVERTGTTCARWLCEYCIEQKKTLPECFVHTNNVNGGKDILSVIATFHKIHKTDQ